LHVVGIEGAGMSAYAIVCRSLGASVTGSDQAESPYLEPVRAAAVDVAIGHDAANVPAGDDVEVVVSTAIPASNPEVAAARERGLRVLSRADLLAELTRQKKTIAVAGAHGKTTTSSMVAHALLGCGLDPAYVIGGTLSTTGTNAAWGSGDWLVVEADESDRSFLALDVDVAVVTNVELDHHTEWASLGELEGAFRRFLAGAPVAVLPAELLPLRGDGRTELFADWEGPELAVPGEHNRRNAAAALEAAVLAGAERARAAAELATFRGAGRRFERLGTTTSGAVVVDDYAHHPTEVAATIAAARELGYARVVAVFQPHLYSRTQHLYTDFGRALSAADLVGVLDVYPARERAEDFPGVTGRLIAEAVEGQEALWLPDFDAAERALAEELRAGDLLLVLGAGDVDALGRRLVAEPNRS
ncbi:MAG TPA: Mur ligase domain-containing protein, partial [Solirubrobacteraceae bacterium]|nr:Mur ligase domain-containing protein [Solirubrobacteraceae bacterium]